MLKLFKIGKFNQAKSKRGVQAGCHVLSCHKVYNGVLLKLAASAFLQIGHYRLTSWHW